MQLFNSRAQCHLQSTAAPAGTRNDTRGTGWVGSSSALVRLWGFLSGRAFELVGFGRLFFVRFWVFFKSLFLDGLLVDGLSFVGFGVSFAFLDGLFEGGLCVEVGLWVDLLRFVGFLVSFKGGLVLWDGLLVGGLVGFLVLFCFFVTLVGALVFARKVIAFVGILV